jgi:phenylpropionate dioxygenase-like ring-hydroxylating dioxygenase large terminal subunit
MKYIVYNDPSTNIAALVYPAPHIDSVDKLKKLALKVVPEGTSYNITESGEVPLDRGLRNAWQVKEGNVIVNLSRAKEICHQKRREVRAAEFAPWDIKTTVPHLSLDAEQERQKIRDKYVDIQTQIKEATIPEELSTIHAALSLKLNEISRADKIELNQRT